MSISARIGKHKIYGLIALENIVIDKWNIDGLSNLTRCKGQRAGYGRVIGTGGRGTIGGSIIYRRRSGDNLPVRVTVTGKLTAPSEAL